MASLQTKEANESELSSAPQNDVVFDHIRGALRGLQFGAITIVVQNGRVVQIERQEKTRLIPSH